MSHSPRRWIAVVTVSTAIAAVPAIAPPLTPHDVRVVDDVDVALTASWSPEQQAVIDDFQRGGLAEVLRVQGTTRLTQPDQVQIINDFFEGGVLQTEGRRWISLFNDPQQQAFLTDLLAGGVVQVVRNRLLDSTNDPSTRAAIIAFFPDEITDYRGGPITMLQRRLIAAAKGNQFVIGLVNAVFDNPVVLTVRRLIGGGPIIGTPLPDLPAVDQPVNSSLPVETSTPEVAQIAAPAETKKSKPVVAIADSTTEATAPAEAGTDPEPVAEPTATADTEEPAADVVKTGNKVAPTTLAGPSRQKPTGGGFGIFGQVAEAVTAGLAGLAGAYSTPAPTAPTAPAAAAETASSTGAPAGDTGES